MKTRSLCLAHPSRATTLKRYCLVLLPLVLFSAELWAQSGAWTRKKDIPTGRATACAAVVNNKIYVIGGVDKNLVGLADYEVYDPSADTWEAKKALPTPRGFVSAAAVNGIIYAIGGRYMGAGTSEVLAYDPVADTGWTPRAPLLSPRFGAAAGAIDGIIYNVGGNHYEHNCEAYNPATDKWTRKTDIPGTYGGIAVAPCGGLLYAIGGGFSDVFQTVYTYDAKTDGWTNRKDMPTPRGWSHPAPVVDGRIYVVGGYKKVYGEVLSDVEVYDPVLDSWRKEPDMPFTRTMFAAAAVNGKIYIIGGTTDFNSVEKDVWEYDPLFTSVGRFSELPGHFVLGQNYPNPFNPSTTIKYELPTSSDVRLTVFDMLGREVAVLVNEKKAPGSYEVKFDAAGIPSGVYLCRLTAGSFVQTRKMIVVK
jgi:N-acetylneuraminic acid mutarotase